MSAGASPQTPLGALTALPQIPSWFQGGRFAAGGDGGKGREGLGGGERGREGKVGWEGGKRGEVGGIAPWSLGG